MSLMQLYNRDDCIPPIGIRQEQTEGSSFAVPHHARVHVMSPGSGMRS